MSILHLNDDEKDVVTKNKEREARAGAFAIGVFVGGLVLFIMLSLQVNFGFSTAAGWAAFGIVRWLWFYAFPLGLGNKATNDEK